MNEEKKQDEQEREIFAVAKTAVDDLQAKCDEYLAGWKRAQADYANLKRETEKEKSEFIKFANSELLMRLLPAADGLEAALITLPESTDKDWAKGFKAVHSQVSVFLREAGLEKINCSGQIDPLIHEAVAQQESEINENEIVQIVQSGWKLNDRVLRPAKVIIAKHKKLNP